MADHSSVELQCVKALFEHKQYRQCIQMSRQLLDLSNSQGGQPSIKSVFLSFYQALCYDELARAMHINSKTVLPAIEEAENIYLSTLLMITDLVRTTQVLDHDPRGRPCLTLRTPVNSSSLVQTPIDQSPTSDLARSESLSSISSELSEASLDFHETPTPIAFHSPTHCGRFGFANRTLIRSPQPIRPIRKVPKISLIDSSPKSRLPVSVTQSLLKPVRLGSPPKPYLHYTQSLYNLQALPRMGSPLPLDLPELCTADISSIAEESPNRTPCQEAEVPELKVFVRNDSDEQSRSSPGPPASLERILQPAFLPATVVDRSCTPPSTNRPYSLLTSPSIPSSPPELLQTPSVDHLDALRIQLHTHLKHLDILKTTALGAQLQRQKSLLPNALLALPSSEVGDHEDRFAPRTSPTSSSEPSDLCKPGLPPGRSFWTFVPDHVRDIRRQERIVQGRARRWARNRWDPTPYQTLADKALAEL